MIVTLLGTAAFLSSGFLPSPVDKMVIGIQALCFSLATLLVPRGGATFASLVAGVLLTITKFWFFPFSLLFSVFYGLLIDAVFMLAKGDLKASKSKLILLLVAATGAVGVVSMYLTTLMGLLPMIPAMYIGIIAFAFPNGAIAGYLALTIWEKHLSHLVGQ